MIRYALRCHDCCAEYEAWFASSQAYDRQAEAGLVTCPECEGANTSKQIMAPAIAGSSRDASGARGAELAKWAAKARRHIAENFDYVGESFATEAREIHEGNRDARPIWGQASLDEARALAEDGVPALPLPEPLAPKPPKPDGELN
jgi:hypothetical protein